MRKCQSGMIDSFIIGQGATRQRKRRQTLIHYELPLAADKAFYALKPCSENVVMLMNSSQRIYLGINLSFAKFVYGPKRSLDLARNVMGAHYVEMVTDIDYGPSFFTMSPSRFRRYHTEVAEYSERIGVRIPTIVTFYRDNAGVANSSPEIRRHAFTVMRSLAAQAGCLKCDVAGAHFGTILNEDMNDKQKCIEAGLKYWKKHLKTLRREGVETATLEPMSTLREPPATISSAKEMLTVLTKYHQENTSTTSLPALCYDVGHGTPESERDNDSDVEFNSWFKTFSTDIVHIHLRNTDPQFLETWPFTKEYRRRGIIDLREIVSAIRKYLSVKKLYVVFELPGKRGRLLGEQESLRANRISLKSMEDALRQEGFQENPKDYTWSVA